MALARRARLSGEAKLFALVLVALLPVSTGLAEPKPQAAPGSVPSATPSATLPIAPTSTASVDPKERKERQARAVEFHNEAKALYERGLYRRAIAKLEAALALDPEGKELVYNLALIHEKLAEADIAEAYYLRYIDMETDPKARERATAIVKRLQGAKKKLKADIEERTTGTSAPSVSTAVPVASTTAEPGPRGPSPMVFVIGGVALAAAGVGIGFGVSALTTRPDNPTTGPNVTAYDLETRARSAHTQAVVADLSFAAAIVVGTTAVLLYLLETRTPRPAVAPLPSSAALGPSPAIPRLRTEVPF